MKKNLLYKNSEIQPFITYFHNMTPNIQQTHKITHYQKTPNQRSNDSTTNHMPPNSKNQQKPTEKTYGHPVLIQSRRNTSKQTQWTIP